MPTLYVVPTVFFLSLTPSTLVDRSQTRSLVSGGRQYAYLSQMTNTAEREETMLILNLESEILLYLYLRWLLPGGMQI